jgi:pimeloyl-ACP methyl ester carboxylesterase
VERVTDLSFEHNGVHLAGLDFPGDGAPVLLLHGLAGYAGEWRMTADWLASPRRVVALDARGHGSSERFPWDVSIAAHAADAAFAIEHLKLGPVIVVGQSLGGLTAITLAATRPDLVRAMVVVDADPESGADHVVDELEDWLRGWPVPFESLIAAARFFGGSPESAAVWANGLERRGDGWWPRFDHDVIAKTLRQALSRSYWNEWERIRCPVLILRAEKGDVTREMGDEMTRSLATARMIEIADAGHDIHLDRPREWRSVLMGFLDGIER